MSEFIRPQVHVEEISDTAARVSVEPLERGYGDTLGNSLRRVLLSSLEGAAVEAIQIDGAQHEFTTIPNMVEDVTDIVLNVKGLVFRTLGTSSLEGAAVEAIQIDGAQHEFTTIPNMVEDVTDIVLNVKGLVFRTLGTTDEGTATISVDGPCEVTGADFFIPSEFELVNPDQHAAVEAIQIDGAQHEFTTIPNMVEDVTDIVLNVKGLVFRTLGTTDEGTATISVDGPCEVTGADFFIPSEFELVNPDQHIATLTEGGHLTMSMRIGYGRGYVSYEQNKRDNDPIGIIHVDSLFSPVKRCAKLVEACRVGQHTDYDRLVLEIETNGAISPRDAVVSAANIINQHMAAFMTLADEPEAEEEVSIFAPEVTSDNAELDKQIEEISRSRIWTFPSAPTTASSALAFTPCVSWSSSPRTTC